MLLTVDVGNTNIVLGLFDGDHLFASYRLRTDARVTADELALLFHGLLAKHPDPDGISVCSTVPQVLDDERRDLKQFEIGFESTLIDNGMCRHALST